MEGYRQDENLSSFFGKPVWIKETTDDDLWYALFTKEAIYVSFVSNYELADIGDVLLSKALPKAYLELKTKDRTATPWEQKQGTPPGDPVLWLTMNCWSML